MGSLRALGAFGFVLICACGGEVRPAPTPSPTSARTPAPASAPREEPSEATPSTDTNFELETWLDARTTTSGCALLDGQGWSQTGGEVPVFSSEVDDAPVPIRIELTAVFGEPQIVTTTARITFARAANSAPNVLARTATGTADLQIDAEPYPSTTGTIVASHIEDQTTGRCLELATASFRLSRW